MPIKHKKPSKVANSRLGSFQYILPKRPELAPNLKFCSKKSLTERLIQTDFCVQVLPFLNVLYT